MWECINLKFLILILTSYLHLNQLQIFLEKAKNFREKRREQYKKSKVGGTQVKQQVKTPKRKAEEVQPTPTTATQDNSKKERKILSDSQVMMREADIRAANKAV